jgi:long-chain acyl-CoA synthetase
MIRPGEDVDEKILKEFLGNRIAAFKVPEKIFFQHEQLPRGSTGKIAKKQIRTQTIEKLQA